MTAFTSTPSGATYGLTPSALWRAGDGVIALGVHGPHLCAQDDALLAWGDAGAQVIWLDPPTPSLQAIPGSAGLWAAALLGREALLLHGGGAPRLERWRLRAAGFDEPWVEPLPLPSPPPSRPLCAHIAPCDDGLRLVWVERRRAVWGAPKGLVSQALPLDLDAARWAGVAHGRAYILAQQHHGALHGPWWWLSLDLARPDLPPWISPALRAGLMPLAAAACDRHGLFAATREGLWWFDKQGLRRDLVPWPHPDAAAAAAAASSACLSPTPRRRDLLLAVDGAAWRWDMKPLRSRHLPALKPLRVPRDLSARDLADAARAAFDPDLSPPAPDPSPAPPAFALPSGASPDGLIGWRRRNAPPCYTKPPHPTPSHPAGVIDLTVGPSAAWELFGVGLMRRRPHDPASPDAVYLVIPPPTHAHASPDGGLAVTSHGHVTWLDRGHTPLASLPLSSPLPPYVSASPLGWLIGDGDTWRALSPSLSPLTLAPRDPDDPSASACLRLRPDGTTQLALASATHHALLLPDLPPIPLPPDADQAALHPTGRALALRTPLGVTLWRDLDPSRATLLLHLPADLIGWLHDDLLLHFQGETWRVTPPGLPPDPAPPAPSDTPSPLTPPLTPPHHVAIDITDLDADTRDAAASLAADASSRWPAAPSLTLAPLLIRAARALTTSQRLHLRATDADAPLDDLQRRADADLSLPDLDTLRALLPPTTFGRLLPPPKTTDSLWRVAKPEARAPSRPPVDLSALPPALQWT